MPIVTLERLGTVKANAAELASDNRVWASGWIIKEIDTDKQKIADGVTAYNDLPYGGVKDAFDAASTADSKADAAQTTADNAATAASTADGKADRQIKKNGHIGQFLSKIKTQPVRVLLTGTSIASFPVSAIQIAARTLQSKYGKAGTVEQLGAYGGTYNASGGFAKQRYGGSRFYRLVMQPGNSDLTYSRMVKKIILTYSKETEGQSFDVWIDGVFDRTLTSNGAQSYNNEAVFTFEEKDYHTITIKAPASGYAFLEKLEFISEDSGILIEDGTLGGAGINDYYVANATIGTGNLAPVAISSQNGINSFFDRQGETKADLIICQHYTNDSLETLTTGINDAVSLTKSNNTPLVLVSEQPALNFVTAEGVLTEERESMAQLLRNAANNAHVSLIDWIKMVDFSVRNEYEARYFPGADKTHPSQEGAAIPLPSLLDLFSIPSPGHQSIYRSAKDLIKPASGKSPDFSEGYDKSSADKGVVLTNNNVGRKEGRVIIGAAVNGVTNQLAPLTFSLNAVNQVIGGDSNAEIQSNPDGADQFGAYKNDAVTKFVFGHRYLSKETVCSVVLLVRKINEALPGISFTSPTNNHVPRLYVNDSLVSGNQWLFSDYQVEDNEPYFVYGHLRLNTSSSPEKYIQINCSNLAVYGIWCVNGKAPTLSGKELERTRRISTPLLMVGDLTPAQVHNGQIYFEDIDSVTVEKEAVDSSVIKPRNGSDYYNLFKCLNKSVIDFHYIRPTSVENTSYDNFAGGYTSTISAGGDFRVTLSGFTAWEKTYTVFIPVSFVETYVSIQIYMFNPGNNTYVYLNNDLSWSLAPANPDEVIECSGENTAITFNMPDEATFSALGSNPQFRIAVVGNAKVATATLCQGSSACI